jgi:tetratricopeptide (TPR) repeat protein
MAGLNSVFLSYASQDAVVAARIGEALREAGIEVWFDRAELRGGDLWHENIQRQIRECRLFLPIISNATESRGEGYFRLEWKLAIDRSHTMASDQRFIVPIVIDGTLTPTARVPDRFHDYQWTELPGGEPTPSFLERIAALLVDEQTPKTDKASASGQNASSLVWSGTLRRRPWALPAALALGVSVLAAAWLLHRSHAAVVPYSSNDRRMTFAALPFLVADQDARTKEAAAANSRAYAAALERNDWWATTVDQGAVELAAARFRSSRDIAKALNVHFLLRGTASRTPTGYSVSASIVDGETERTILTDTVKADDPSLLSSRTADYDDSVAELITSALHVEVERAATKPEESLDVRDLTFRGYTYWFQHGGNAEAYQTAQRLLDRALKLSPDDFLALEVTAEVNLCDCVQGWAADLEKETAIGAAAVDKIARLYPSQPTTSMRIKVLMLRRQYAEVLVLSDFAHHRKPEDLEPLHTRIWALIHLGRTNEATASLKELEEHNSRNKADTSALIAAVEYATGNYASALQHAQAATAVMTDDEFKDTTSGEVRLTLAATQARLGSLEQARATMKQFWGDVPEATTIAKIQRWMYPTADLYGFQPLFDGLELAGVDK